MYILLNNDFKIDRELDKEAPSNQEITRNWILQVVSKGYEAGLNQDKRRIFTLLAEKLDKAIKDNTSYVEVNSVEHQFLKEAFEKAVMNPSFALPITIVETAVLNASETLPE